MGLYYTRLYLCFNCCTGTWSIVYSFNKISHVISLSSRQQVGLPNRLPRFPWERGRIRAEVNLDISCVIIDSQELQPHGVENHILRVWEQYMARPDAQTLSRQQVYWGWHINGVVSLQSLVYNLLRTATHLWHNLGFQGSGSLILVDMPTLFPLQEILFMGSFLNWH